MSLPEVVRVKLSSEAAEYLSMTPVVARDMPLRELVERMLGVTGKDAARVQELLLRGSLVSGASRFRWTGWEADRAALESLLAGFPDPQPGRPFAAEHCLRAVLKGPACRIEVTREPGSRRRLLRRKSFWDLLMEVASAGEPVYLDYSYGERADRYTVALAAPDAARLRHSAALLRYSRLEQQVRGAALEAIELFVAR